MSDPVRDEELTKVEGGWLTHDREIRVRQEDIDHGRARDQGNCAIVRAIQRTYPDAVRVRVNAKLTGFSIGEIRYTYPTPQTAIESIIKPFDRGEEVEPVTIRLRGGKMRDVHHTDTVARNARRLVDAERKDRKITERIKQMSPNYSEYERF